MSLKGKTLFITGASRGIGLAIALRAARDGANVAIAAKTAEPHPKLPGTIYTAAEEIEKAGGKALPLVVDMRDEDAGARRRSTGPRRASAASTSSSTTPAPSQLTGDAADRHEALRPDAPDQHARHVHGVANARIPHLEKAANPHILMLSPPLDMEEKWFAPHIAYTMAKFGMSLCVLGLAGEFAAEGIAVNALWPRTAIATAAVRNLLGGDAMMRALPHAGDPRRRRLSRSSRSRRASFTGHFLIDDTFLAGEGVTDFDQYRVDPTRDADAGLLRAGRASRRRRA